LRPSPRGAKEKEKGRGVLSVWEPVLSWRIKSRIILKRIKEGKKIKTENE